MTCPHVENGVCQRCPGWVVADPHFCEGMCDYIKELERKVRRVKAELTEMEETWRSCRRSASDPSR